jgi:uncharacterized protein
VRSSSEREKVRFQSGDTYCAAWHYPGTNGACVVMAGGLAVTKEPGTDPFARRFNDAGFSVVAFDYRRLGESGGEPRQVVRIRDQQADFQAAIDFARTLDVDPARIAIWGFSLSGGHVFPVAARNPGLAAAIAQSPLADGPAATPNAMRHQTPGAALRLTGLALLDAAEALVGRGARLVPLAGERGTLASITTPDALNGPAALDPTDDYPDWRQEVAARSALRLGFYRPARCASRIQCPLLVVAHDDDGVALAEPAARAARRAPRGELARLPGGHYEAFMGGRERAGDVLLSFLTRHLVERSEAGRQAA